MIAIETKYLASTGRIKATADGRSIFHSASGNTDDAHGAAGAALARKLNWHPEVMLQGWTSRGCVFVFAESDKFDVSTGARISEHAPSNENGLTYRDWLAAAAQTASVSNNAAWMAGEDPTDYRA